MSRETEVLRSSIPNPLLRALLIRGTVLGVAGISILIYGGVLVSHRVLEHWGWLWFLAGVFLVTLGLRPYRRLSQLQLHPYSLSISAEAVDFGRGGKTFYTLPLSLIASLRHVDERPESGILVTLHKEHSERIRVLDPHFPMAEHLTENKKKFGGDLFCPFFSTASLRALAEHLEAGLDDIVHTDEAL
jgi:hypothetical protein